MLTGLDQLSSGHAGNLRRRLRSARVGLLTHAAAIDRRGRHALDVLEELGVTPTLLFSPEHGLDAVAQAEEAVAGSGKDGITIASLYGEDRDSLRPTADQLGQIELLVIDLVDIGSRYYTYIWTALLALRAAAAAGVHVIVLDRPNPLSGDPRRLEGAPQAEGFSSFVGLEPLPIRHSMTIAEVLLHFCERDGVPLGPEGAASVVATRGWERFKTAEAWGRPFIPPSPNMPTLETALLYPGGCLVEGTNLSEGRGTTSPFSMVGAPYLDGRALAAALLEHGTPGALVRPISFRPSFEKHAGQVCHGVMLHVTDAGLFRPVATYLTLITLARAQAPEAFAFRSEPYEFETEIPAFDLLTGSAAARQAIEEGAPPADVAALVCPVPPELREVVLAGEARLQRAEA